MQLRGHEPSGACWGLKQLKHFWRPKVCAHPTEAALYAGLEEDGHFFLDLLAFARLGAGEVPLTP